MRNSRKIDDTWKAFCESNALTLTERQKKFFYGMTYLYSALENEREYVIEYNYRYEVPDSGVKPEELTIQYQSRIHRFKTITVKRTGLIKSLLGSKKIDIQCDGELNVKVYDKIKTFYTDFPNTIVRVKDNHITFIILNFPDSVAVFNGLRQFVIGLSNEIRA